MEHIINTSCGALKGISTKYDGVIATKSTQNT